MMVYPVLGSALSEELSFSGAQEIFGVVNLIVLVVYLGSSAYDWRKGRKQELEENN